MEAIVNGDVISELMAVNPLLFFKDFDAEGDFVTDTTFMTTADVPVLAMQGLVKEMKNPLTGKEINMKGKEAGADIDTEYSVFSMNSIMDSKQFSSDASWYHVDDDIFDPADWIKIK